MHIKILFCCLLLFGVMVYPEAVRSSETDVEVRIEGIDGRLLDNVRARLRLVHYQESGKLQETEIRRLHQLAPGDIVSALKPYGYYDARVESTLEPGPSGWLASYRVIPGEAVRISELTVRIIGPGSNLEAFKDPVGLFGLVRGEILNQPRYQEGKQRLLRQARSQGYLDAVFSTREIRVYPERREAEIELVMDTGVRYFFGTTSSDRQIISDELLARFLPYRPGAYFAAEKLYELQRELYRTDYFGEVTVTAELDQAENREIPVTVNLTELEHYNRYSFGVGYATDTGLRALFEWRNRLLNQSGHRAEVSLLAGEQDSHVSFDYQLPGFDPRHQSLGSGLSWSREKWEGTTTQLISAGTSFNYRNDALNYGISLELRDERYQIGTLSGDSLILMPQVHGSFALADDLVNTSNGLRVSVSAAGGVEKLISDVSFAKLRGDGTLIVSPFPRWRLIGRGSIGGILVESIDRIPPSLRFYAGGAKSVRGYQYKTLGPVEQGGELVGGTFLLTGGIEVEYQINDYLRTFVFYDLGNAMDDLSVNLASGVGGGLGLVLPFGHAKLELAYPLNNEGEPQYLYLSVGADL